MATSTRTKLGALLLGLSCISGPAFAQQEVSAAAQLDEIIVTARKREESLQRVPLSITAITAVDIENQGVSDLRDVVNLTPGLTMSEFGAGTLNVPVIRGMTNLTGGSFAESNVAVFYNGVYLQNNNLVDATFLDVERVEVVKGPVSALYGRNAYAGVINYVTKRPSETFRGSASAIGGTSGRRSLQASLSGPLTGPGLKASIAGRYDASDGSWKDPSTGVRFNGYDKYSVQGNIEANPADKLNMLATMFYSNDQFDQSARYFLNQGNCGAPVGSFQTSICGQIPDFDENTVIRSANPNFKLYGNKRDMLLGTFDARLELDSLELKSLTAFTNTSQFQRRDQDGTGVGFTFPLAGLPAGTTKLSTYFIGGSEDKSLSQELRASLKVNDQITLTLGGFYNKYTADQTITLAVDPTNIPAGRTAIVAFPIGFLNPATGEPTNIQRTRLEDKEVSSFGIVEFKPTPELRVSAEARRSKQTKLQNQTSSFLTSAFRDPDGANGITGNWSFWSFRFSTDYQITPASLVYASVAQGNKAGGFNSGAPNPADLQYNPERNRTYEIGLKTTLFNGAAVFDVAAFYAKLADLQLSNISANGLTAAIRNAGNAKAHGFEASLSGKIADGVRVGVGLAYANPTFKNQSFLNSGQATSQCRNIPACASRVQTIPGSALVGIDLGGLSLPRESDWQLNALLDVRQPLSGAWNWTFRGNYKYESKQYATTPPVNNGYVGSKQNLNLRAGVIHNSLSVELFVDNLLNDATPFNYGTGLNPSNFQAPIAIVYGAKRTFGLEASMKF